MNGTPATAPTARGVSLTDERRFRALIENVSDVICLIDREARITYVSPSVTPVLGCTPEELLGHCGFDLIHPATRREAEAIAALLMQRPGESRRFETRLRHRDGSWRWVEVVATNLLDDPDVGALVINYRDISERRRSEESVRSSERHFRAFFETVGLGNAEAEPFTGRLLRVNRKFCEITGFSADALQTMSLSDLIQAEHRDFVSQTWRRALEKDGPEAAVETRSVRKDGSAIWIQLTATVIRNDTGNPVRVLTVIRDVTDRRRAVEELRQARANLEDRIARRTAELSEAKQQLETLIAASPLSIIALDLDLRVQSWNPAAEKLFGWKADEVLGKPLPSLPRENRQQYLRELRSTVGSPALVHYEALRRRRDGTLVEVSVWRAPLYDSDGKLTGSMAIVMDISERKRLERALLAASEREQRRIGQDLHDHLCQHLLGAACVLRVLATAAEREGSSRAPELHRVAHLVNDAVQQARDIARGLHPVELDSEGLMSALRELAQRVSATVPCELDCERPVLFEDPEAAMHVYRIAQEAVTNAMKHADAKHIHLQLAEDGKQLSLRIRDDGRGMPADLPRGRGMGVDIMRYRAHAIGASLAIETQPSGGTALTCTIPRHP